MHEFRCYDNSAERETSASACTRSMPGSISCGFAVDLLYNKLWDSAECCGFFCTSFEFRLVVDLLWILLYNSSTKWRLALCAAYASRGKYHSAEKTRRGTDTSWKQ